MSQEKRWRVTSDKRYTNLNILQTFAFSHALNRVLKIQSHSTNNANKVTCSKSRVKGPKSLLTNIDKDTPDSEGRGLGKMRDGAVRTIMDLIKKKSVD